MKRYFQPLDSDRIDETWILKSMFREDGLVFCSFENGETINIEYIAPMTVTDVRELFGSNKYLIVEIPSPDNRWRYEKITTISVKDEDGFIGEVPPIEDYGTKNGRKDIVEKSSVGQRKLIPPAINPGIIYSGLPKLEDFEPVSVSFSYSGVGSSGVVFREDDINDGRKTPPPSPSVPAHSAVPDDSPVSILVGKAKKSPQTFSLTITIDAPSHAIYEACRDFENGDDEFIGSIIESSKDRILDAVKDALKKKYSE